MQTTQTIQFSKLDYCPECHRKLCRRKTVQGVTYVEYKHKGSQLLAREMVVRCIGCGRNFIVEADAGIIDEVTIGHE